MGSRILVIAVILAVCCCGLQAAEDTNGVQRFVQEKFLISFWFDPPADANMDKHYRQIAEANFTVTMGRFGAHEPNGTRRQIALSEKYGMGALIYTGGFEANELPNSKTVWGYMIQDEPSAADFPKLQKRVAELRAVRPGKLAFINLFPDYATPEQLGTKTYEEYVDKFVKEVNVDVLSMDYYPHFKPGKDERDGYCGNLEVMRKFSLERGIPFWNFFNTMLFQDHTDPTEAQIRWQIWTSLTYGAKGVMYFCYWTPGGKGEFIQGWALVTSDGRLTRHYEQAKRINAELKKLGPTLMKLNSTGAYRVKTGDDYRKILAGTPIKSLTAGEYLVGVFKHADGRRAVMLNNYEFAYTSWPTVVFDGDPNKVVEVSSETGKEIAIIDDSPNMEGLQISLDAGMGRLFLLP